MEVEANIEPINESVTTGEDGAGAGEADPRILKRLQKIFANCHNFEEWRENRKLCLEAASLFEHQGRASLTKVRFDSVHFFVRVKLGPDHDAFLRACTDGTLSRGLTKILVTPELKEAAGVKLRLRLDVKETSNTSNVSAPAEHSPVAIKTLQEMNPTDVQKWLIEEVHVSISIATKFAEAGVDGELLIRYEEQHLQKDFELPTGVMRKIIYARDDRTKTRVNTHQHHPLASEKHTDNLGVDAGTIDLLR
ncbi:uncharacterized protein LOC105441747 [Strongylocentrotus purpuratus]|uniref:Uncharacterized protein n=1 Tax=Strongylocentrotus purpuratus TaxID=7668 RepID=A0A7M7PSG6_STRPU|nr:uncharacterized protein LOC105441747 [Strongylocentrotus purpuratus]